ncbi:MAG: hypothetical protein JWR40_3219 [Massilia sp.]|jgi:hypothetical protein|nr:hypothetical protein [Massilia sp.]MDB5949855.1 hypothetical protein [Massilia sp.]
MRGFGRQEAQVDMESREVYHGVQNRVPTPNFLVNTTISCDCIVDFCVTTLE